MPPAVRTGRAISSSGIVSGPSAPGARDPPPGPGADADSLGAGVAGNGTDGLGDADGGLPVGVGSPLSDGPADGSSDGEGLGLAVGVAGAGVGGGGGGTVGGGVGRGAGGSVGAGVGLGAGAAMVTAPGETVVSCAVTSPAPLPETAEKEYVRLPAGRVIDRWYTTPAGDVVARASAKVPTPAMVTVMLVGAQPALSLYVTLKTIAVEVEPLPGVAVPRDRAISCDAPLQLAARTGIAVGSSTTQAAARRKARVIFIVGRVASRRP